MKNLTSIIILSAITALNFNVVAASEIHSLTIVKQQLKAYIVKFKVGSTTSQRTLHLHSASESEAIAQLKKENTIRKDDSVIILSIKPA